MTAFRPLPDGLTPSDLDNAAAWEAEADALRSRAVERYSVGNLYPTGSAERRRLRRAAAADMADASRILARAHRLTRPPARPSFRLAA